MSRQQQQQTSSRDRFEDYVPVAERVEKFYDRFPDGRVITQILEHDRETGFVLMRADVYRHADDAQPAATGHAFENKDAGYVQRTSYIEVAETSAVGRALALLGFEVRRGIASREEMQKVQRAPAEPPIARPTPPPPSRLPPPSAGSGRADPPAKAVDAATTTTNNGGESSLDTDILQAADALGYDAAKVSKWVNHKFKVSGGLEALSVAQKREVLRLFREQAQPR